MKFIEFLNTLSLTDKIKYLVGKVFAQLIYKQTRYHKLQKLKIFYNDISKAGYEINRNETAIQLSKQNEVIRLRNNTSDDEVFKQIFIEKEYEPVLDCIRINNISVSTIVDAGSNIGLSSLKFSSAFPQSAIFCLEPDAENFKALNENLKKHENITVLNQALWYKNEEVSLNNDFRDGKEWARSVSSNLESGFKIPAITLTDLMQKFNLTSIDLLKIDIEGAEERIFKIENDLSFLNKVKIIAMEIHDEFNCRDTIYQILRTYGFKLFNSKETTIGVK